MKGADHEDNRRPTKCVEVSSWWFFPFIVLISAATGLRKSKVLNLLWAEVDFIARIISVIKKPGKKAAKIPMIGIVMEALRYIEKNHRYSEYVFAKGGSDLDSGLPVNYIVIEKK